MLSVVFHSHNCAYVHTSLLDTGSCKLVFNSNLNPDLKLYKFWIARIKNFWHSWWCLHTNPTNSYQIDNLCNTYEFSWNWVPCLHFQNMLHFFTLNSINSSSRHFILWGMVNSIQIQFYLMNPMKRLSSRNRRGEKHPSGPFWQYESTFSFIWHLWLAILEKKDKWHSVEETHQPSI